MLLVRADAPTLTLYRKVISHGLIALRKRPTKLSTTVLRDLEICIATEGDAVCRLGKIPLDRVYAML
ncbi:MAG: hypothetical protein NVSMB52_10360 [Chloroflexota bacterium]